MGKPIILLAIVVGIFVGILGSFLPLIPSEQISVTSPDYWRGTTDQRLSQIEAKIDAVSRKMDAICDDMLAVRIEQAKTGVLYGVFSSIGIYLLGTFVQILFNRKKK